MMCLPGQWFCLCEKYRKVDFLLLPGEEIVPSPIVVVILVAELVERTTCSSAHRSLVINQIRERILNRLEI